MGAKTPEKLKLLRSESKCDLCNRKFANVQALTSHRKFMHKSESTPAKRVAIKKEAGSKQGKVTLKATKKVANRSEQKKNENKIQAPKTVNKPVTKPVIEINTSKKRTSTKNIEFKCPKCIKVFSVYFSAYRHIQKYHCLDDNDEPVPPNSPDLIKPIRIELTPCCNEWILATETHNCKRITEHVTDTYMCLGCQQSFDSLVVFEHHVKGLHAADAEYYFFPNNLDLTAWKMDLEEITGLKFVTLTNKQKSKQIYHCTYQPAFKADKALLCPSSLLVTEFKNGYQVIYFKEHFGHTCTESPIAKYKKNSINLVFNDNDAMKNIDNDDDVYQHFKNIMGIITVSAAKVDIGALNLLLGKALEMTIALNDTVNDDEQSIGNKSMTDDQISDVLSEVKTYPGKRKAESIKRDAKKIKPSLENDENTKLNNSVPVTVNKLKKNEDLSSSQVPRPLFNQSPSFNDSYKDFVGQNFKSSLTETSTPKRSIVKKKIVMKTKIGQFKVKPNTSPKTPKNSPSPKRPKTPKKTVEFTVKPDVKYEIKEQENDCNILILKI